MSHEAHRGFFFCTLSGAAIEAGFELILRLVQLHQLGLIPLALTEPLNTDQVNAFASLFFYETNTLVLDVFDFVTGLEFRIAHDSFYSLSAKL